ncbi:hypothetical protein FOZ60_012447, partial [Perkinsus olseni]
SRVLTLMPTILNAETGPIRRRHSSDAYLAAQDRVSQTEGSWACHLCGNINYPDREVCNIKMCKGTRPDSSRWNSGSVPRRVSPPPLGHFDQRSDGRAPLFATTTEDAPTALDWSPVPITEGRSFFATEEASIGHHHVGTSHPHPYHPRPHSRAPLPVGGNWTCHSCGNVNYSDRTVCYRRQCGRPREQVEHSPVEPSIHRSSGRQTTAGVSFFAGLGDVAGSWECRACGNVNYPSRIKCNNRRCGLPREEAVVSSLTPQPARTPRGNGPQAGVDGNWLCSACGNVNYASRERCNGRGCGRPRKEVDRGALETLPTARCDGRKSVIGDWTCTRCGNLNYQSRSRCNKKSCGMPREQVEMGSPTARQGGVVEADGCWVCPACSNLNYPHRLKCNRKQCGAPRPIGP